MLSLSLKCPLMFRRFARGVIFTTNIEAEHKTFGYHNPNSYREQMCCYNQFFFRLMFIGHYDCLLFRFLITRLITKKPTRVKIRYGHIAIVQSTKSTTEVQPLLKDVLTLSEKLS
jgi:hypothetical protein